MILVVLYCGTFAKVDGEILSPPPIQYVYFSSGNMCNYFINSGIFNYDVRAQNTPGLFWHCEPFEYYCLTAGFNTACKIDSMLGMFACSYKGELTPGFVNDSMPQTNKDFKIYLVKFNDNEFNNPDYANWYKMVPYNAPYNDVNNNCVFDIGIDKPGVKGAYRTLFITYTDAFTDAKAPGEGFGGGVYYPLLYAEIHFTNWAYEIPVLADVQFLKYEIINKGKKNWNQIHFGMFADPEICGYNRDYIGCDTVRNLGFAYSGDTNVFGAYGIQVFQGPINKATGDTLYMTSFTRTRMPGGGCEGEASGDPVGAYNYMRGYKKDGTSYLDASVIPFRKTKFIFSGDPETNNGWTRNKGHIYNCNGADTGTIYTVYPHDAQFMIGMGADNLTITPGDTQRLYLTQMIRKGFTNENSVTKLKQYADKIKIIFKNYIQKDLEINCSGIGIIAPENYYLSQNYPNPFNAFTTIRFDIPRFSSVKLYIYDIRGREVSKPVNGNFNPGYYTIKFDASDFPSGIYFYRLEVLDIETSNKVHMSNVRKMAIVK